MGVGDGGGGGAASGCVKRAEMMVSGGCNGVYGDDDGDAGDCSYYDDDGRDGNDAGRRGGDDGGAFYREGREGEEGETDDRASRRGRRGGEGRGGGEGLDSVIARCRYSGDNDDDGEEEEEAHRSAPAESARAFQDKETPLAGPYSKADVFFPDGDGADDSYDDDGKGVTRPANLSPSRLRTGTGTRRGGGKDHQRQGDAAGGGERDGGRGGSRGHHRSPSGGVDEGGQGRVESRRGVGIVPEGCVVAVAGGGR